MVTPAFAGPPPNNTGNAVQFFSGAWNATDLLDFPFIIEGDFCGTTPVEASTWGSIKSAYK
jgi:hypothetical protein